MIQSGGLALILAATAWGAGDPWQSGAGTWEFGAEVIRQTAADNYRTIAIRDGEVADFKLALRLRFVAVNPAYQGAGYAVIAVRAQDAGNYYGLILRAGGELQWAEYCAAPAAGLKVWQTFAAGQASARPIAVGDWFRVEVEGTGATLRARAWADIGTPPETWLEADLNADKPFQHRADQAYLFGRVGLGTSNAAVEFTPPAIAARPSQALVKRRAEALRAGLARLTARADGPLAERAAALTRRLEAELAGLPAEPTAERLAAAAAGLDAVAADVAVLRRELLVRLGGFAAACTWREDVGRPAWKANLHCHTRHSDGSQFCDEMAKWYEDHGYHIVALSDHDGYGEQDGGVSYPRFQNDQEVHDWDGDGVLHPEKVYRSAVEAYVRDYDRPAPAWVPRNWKLNRPGEFLVLNSAEVSVRTPHINVIECPTGKIPQPVTEYGFLDWCHNAGGLAFLNHPAGYNGQPAAVIDHPHLSKVDGLEVMNGFLCRDQRKPNPDGRPGFAEPLWNAILDSGRLVWGFANDDAHGIAPDHYAGSGSAWNMIWSTELTKPAVMAALHRGAFHATCGIVVDRVELTADTWTVSSPNATHLRFVGDGGKVLQETDGNHGTYRLTGAESWVRVELWNDTMCYPTGPQFPQKAWLQPIALSRLLD